jgi:hypothetical protein
MTFRHMHQDVQSERLLLVVLEDKQYAGSEYRHIRATVIRRAVPHVMRKENDLDNVVNTYNDAHPNQCQGYRVASYCLTKTSGTYVDDMQLRGQIDTMPRPCRDGWPYGNKVRFQPYEVCANTARAISDFYKKQEKFIDKYGLTRQDDDFYVALNHLAQFLGITRVVFYKDGVRHSSLETASNFVETDIAFAKVRIDEMLKPFLQISEIA